MSKPNKLIIIVITTLLTFIVLVLIFLNIPLATINSNNQSTLYVDGKPLDNGSKITIGLKEISASSELTIKNTKKVFILPFKKYRVESSEKISAKYIVNILGLEKPKDATNELYNFVNNRWLVYRSYGNEADSSSTLTIFNYKKSTGDWVIVYSGSGYDADELWEIVPNDVYNYIESGKI